MAFLSCLDAKLLIDRFLDEGWVKAKFVLGRAEESCGGEALRQEKAGV
jgi:hypothetical protein